MSVDLFWHLHAILLQHITATTDLLRHYKRVGGELVEITQSPQFPVENYIQRSILCAICYFAGGIPHDIMVMLCILY